MLFKMIVFCSKMPRIQRGGRRGVLTRAAARIQGPQQQLVLPPRGRGQGAIGRGRGRARGGRGAVGAVVPPANRGRQRMAPVPPRG